jgi:hypothetical protein
MKFAAGVLVLVVFPPAAPRPPVAMPPPSSWAVPSGQEWLADPVLPRIFLDVDSESQAASESPSSSIDLGEFPAPSSAAGQESPPRAESPAPESEFLRGVGAAEIRAWRQEDDLRRVREWASDTVLAAPLVVPQVVLEAFLPRGLAVGPTTFLYRTASPSSSLSLVVFDQVLFHEAEFVGQAQYAGDGVYGGDFERSQRRVLRRSLSSGFRVTYAMPTMTMDQIFHTAAEQGTLGYALLPPVAGALFYLKGVDQRFDLDSDVRVRVRLASGQNLWRDMHRAHDNPACSIELRLCNFPVGVIASFDLSNRGATPSFVGLGTSFSTVEEMLSREAVSRLPADAR